MINFRSSKERVMSQNKCFAREAGDIFTAAGMSYYNVQSAQLQKFTAGLWIIHNFTPWKGYFT
jgi:hypothetical protein